MRFNIIGNLSKNTGVSQDIQILHGMLSHVLGKDIEVCYVPHFHPECKEAEVNFFIEVINPSLFVYASKNIWIPNPEWTYQTWKPYARMIDEIWVKTHDGAKLFQDWPCPVEYISWTSIDKIMPEKKNFHKAIVPTGKNIWRNPRPIIEVYLTIRNKNPEFYKTLPELNIVYDKKVIQLPSLPEGADDKIKLHGEFMKENEYDELLRECGLCICMSAAEGFGHAVNEAMSAGCVLMLSPLDVFEELVKNAVWVNELKRTPHPQCLGYLMDVDKSSIAENLSYYMGTQFLSKISWSRDSRLQYEKRHADFITTITRAIENLTKDLPTFNLKDKIPKEEELPAVSIVTITKDRRPFIPLAKYNFYAQAYPEDKLEWVIVDDGKDQIKDLISDIPNVKYVLLDEAVSIGKKRNIGVEKASHDIIVMMDDDDVYPNHSVISRVANMLTFPPKECLFSTTIPCYNIHEKKSFMNVPPMTLTMSQRVSEATLCFTRKFWEERKFDEIQIAEGNTFIQDREQKCRELSPQDVIVSLVHKKNTSSRRAPSNMEQNGCHYGFSDELFTLVSEIGESI